MLKWHTVIMVKVKLSLCMHRRHIGKKRYSSTHNHCTRWQWVISPRGGVDAFKTKETLDPLRNQTHDSSPIQFSTKSLYWLTTLSWLTMYHHQTTLWRITRMNTCTTNSMNVFIKFHISYLQLSIFFNQISSQNFSNSCGGGGQRLRHPRATASKRRQNGLQKLIF